MIEHKLKLKPAYEELEKEFQEKFIHDSCSCFRDDMCSICSHEGNPANLIENPDAWHHLCPDCGTIMKDRNSDFDCPHCGFTTCGSC